MTRKHVLAALTLILLILAGVRNQQLAALAAAPAGDVLVAYDPAGPPPSTRILWEPALHNHHIAHEWVSITDFGILDGGGLAHHFSYIVVPRSISRAIPDAARAQFFRFVAAGGTVLTCADAASLKALLTKEAGASHRPPDLRLSKR